MPQGVPLKTWFLPPVYPRRIAKEIKGRDEENISRASRVSAPLKNLHAHVLSLMPIWLFTLQGTHINIFQI